MNIHLGCLTYASGGVIIPILVHKTLLKEGLTMTTNAENEESEVLYVEAVHEDGLHLLLSDGSSWDIEPGPSTKVLLWYPSQRVTVEQAEDTDSYLITNLDTSEPDRVDARVGYWEPDDDEEN